MTFEAAVHSKAIRIDALALKMCADAGSGEALAELLVYFHLARENVVLHHLGHTIAEPK